MSDFTCDAVNFSITVKVLSGDMYKINSLSRTNTQMIILLMSNDSKKHTQSFPIKATHTRLLKW